jgi:hypothetical protein
VSIIDTKQVLHQIIQDFVNSCNNNNESGDKIAANSG